RNWEAAGSAETADQTYHTVTKTFSPSTGGMDLRSVCLLPTRTFWCLPEGPGREDNRSAGIGKPRLWLRSELARQLIQKEVKSRGTALPWGDREAYTLRKLERSCHTRRLHTPRFPTAGSQTPFATLV